MKDSLLGFIMTEQQLLERMKEENFEPFSYEEQKDGSFPIPIGLRRANDEGFLISGKIHLILSVNFKMFTVSSNSARWFFKGIEYLFDKSNVTTNEESNFLKNTTSGNVNTNAKCNIRIKTLNNMKRAKELIVKFATWLSNEDCLDEEISIQSLDKRLSFFNNFSVEYDFSAVRKLESNLITNLGIIAFGDKIYRSVKDSKKKIVKDYSVIMCPTNANQYIEEKVPAEISKYKNWLKSKGVKSHFKAILNPTQDNLNDSLNNIGSFTYPIFRKMKIILFVTFKHQMANTKNKDYVLPISYKAIDIELKSKEKDMSDLEIVSAIHKPLNVTVMNLEKFLTVVNNDDSTNWIKNLYLDNKDKPVLSEHIMDSLLVLEKSLCFNLSMSEIDGLYSLEKEEKPKRRRRRKNKASTTPSEEQPRNMVQGNPDNEATDENEDVPLDTQYPSENDVSNENDIGEAENVEKADSLEEEENEAEEISDEQQEQESSNEKIEEEK